MKLKKAAQTTARRGVSTRVETTVAMEFAESWKPFRKSKISARQIKKRMLRVMYYILGLFYEYILNDMGNVFADI